MCVCFAFVLLVTYPSSSLLAKEKKTARVCAGQYPSGKNAQEELEYLGSSTSSVRDELCDWRSHLTSLDFIFPIHQMGQCWCLIWEPLCYCEVKWHMSKGSWRAPPPCPNIKCDYCLPRIFFKMFWWGGSCHSWGVSCFGFCVDEVPGGGVGFSPVLGLCHLYQLPHGRQRWPT